MKNKPYFKHVSKEEACQWILNRFRDNNTNLKDIVKVCSILGLQLSITFLNKE